MTLMRTHALFVLTTALASAHASGALGPEPEQTPRAVIDLATHEGAQLARARWRYSDASLREAPPVAGVTGASSIAYDLVPNATAREFDDSTWQVVDPASLSDRRGGGKVSFNWHRLTLTIPERIGDVDAAASTVVFHLRLDDYAEVWIDGESPRRLGQQGGAVVAGWNAPNRVVIADAATPGQTVTLAIFGINGPISEVPGNRIWIREARLEFYKSPRAVTPHEVEAELIRLDPAIDAIIPEGFRVERIAEGFIFTEGPVWVKNEARLLFSDPNANAIYAWTPDNQVRLFRAASGYSGADVAEYRQPGSNGLTLDHQGRLVINEHGNRRVSRLERDGAFTILADRYQGLRLNSPNDLVYKSDGALYFTDPPFGLPRVYDDPRKEMPYCGVFRLKDGKLQLLTTELVGPNGVCFSPKEDYLYVGDWDEANKVVLRFPVLHDGTLGKSEVFADFTANPGYEAIDGVKTDWMGNVYVCGPGGLWILSPEGTRLGVLKNVETPHNIAFGGVDGKTLFMTCHTGLYRVRLNVSGPLP